MKILIQFSGGKDSTACLLWALNESGFKKENIEAVFCDTGFEHEITYKYINEVAKKLNIKLTILKSSSYENFFDLALKKKRFPSTKSRFCTTELKIKPMIDYILDNFKEHLIIIQGIRAEESRDRSLMNPSCSYFRNYFIPREKKDKKTGKIKLVYDTYRKKDVLNFKKTFLDDVIRPVFDWSANKTLTYILKNGLKPNPLYYKSMSRVGCFPCIQVNKKELRSIIENFPERIDLIRDFEMKTGSSFFPPKYIPPKYCSKSAINKKGELVKYATIDDVIYYLKFGESLDLFIENEESSKSCMSYYNICE